MDFEQRLIGFSFGLSSHEVIGYIYIRFPGNPNIPEKKTFSKLLKSPINLF